VGFAVLCSVGCWRCSDTAWASASAGRVRASVFVVRWLQQQTNNWDMGRPNLLNKALGTREN